jgi:O-antigen/teichoic acid export membrane protein
MSLTQKTFTGLKWSTASTIINAGVQVGYTAVMARLLDPKDFGLFAMASLFMRFGNYFAYMGLGKALVQKVKIDEYDIRATFTLSLILSIVVAIIMILIAPLSELIFKTPNLAPLVRILALGFIVNGLTSTSIALLRRDFNFKGSSIAEMISFVLGYVTVGVVLAYLDYGVYALVLTQISQGFLLLIIYYSMTKHSLKLYFNIDRYKSLFAFGGKVSLISFFEFISGNFDTFFIGRLFGAGTLGFYNRAQMLVQLPVYYLSNSFGKVFFPAFSVMQDNYSRLAKNYGDALMVLSFVLFPMCIGIAIYAEPIVLTLLGNDWRESIILLRFISLYIPFRFLIPISGLVCEAIAKLNFKIVLETSYIIIGAILVMIFREYGIRAFILILLTLDILRNIYYLYQIEVFLDVKHFTFIKKYIPAFYTSLLIAASMYLSLYVSNTFQLSSIFQLIIGIIVGVVLLMLSIHLKFNRIIREMIVDKADKLNMTKSKLFSFFIRT